MNITPYEAKKVLDEIDLVSRMTKQAIGNVGGQIMMIWGVIWFLGFSGIQYLNHGSEWMFWILDIIGFIVTGWCIKKSNFKINRNGDVRVVYSFAIICAYAILWGFLLHPSGRVSIALMTTLFMAGYVILGLWTNRVIAVVGIVGTIVSVIGFYYAGKWYPLWVGVFGGGSMFFSGFYLTRFWK